MQTKITKYGLRHIKTGEIAGVDRSSNADGEFCCDMQHILSLSSDEMWMAEDTIGAEYVRLNSTPWYNATEDTPTNDIEPEELEVVKITITTDIAKTEVTIPTFEEYMQERYGTPGVRRYDPGHVAYIMEEYKKRPHDWHYSLYDLRDLIFSRESRGGE